MTDERMADIAIEYMKQMGLVNTPFIVVRHYDKAHPHCHLVFSCVNYDGKILTQTTNFKRNERVRKALNKKYGLHMITWPEYRAAHMDLPVQEALRRFRAIKRGQNPNTMTGGMRM